MSSPVSQRKLSPPQVARLWGISPEKVLAWVRSGELPAVNVATRLRGRPRYRIDVADLAAFERKRTVQPDPPRKRRRRKVDADTIQFF